MNKRNLITTVLNDLKDYIPYDENIQIGECNTVMYIGRFFHDENKIVISNKIRNEHNYKCILAHFLLVSSSIFDDKKHLQKTLKQIETLNLDYDVMNTAKKLQQKFSNKYKKSTYVIFCQHCDKIWYHKRTKEDKITQFKCPTCGNKCIVRRPQSKRGIRLKRKGELK